MPNAPQSIERVAFSPGEFASMFGKSQTWGYRQIYAGKVTTITEHGRILIPAKEVERILESAGIYDGKSNPKRNKSQLIGLPSGHQTIWKKFVELRKQKSQVDETGHVEAMAKGEKGFAVRKRAKIPDRISNRWRKQ